MALEIGGGDSMLYSVPLEDLSRTCVKHDIKGGGGSDLNIEHTSFSL